VFEGDKLVGIAPLHATPRSLCGFRRIRFLGHLFSDYCDIVCSQNYEEVVVERLVRHWKSIFGSGALFDFNRIHESSPTPLFLRRAIAELQGKIYEIPWDKAPALNLIDRNAVRTGMLDAILSKTDCRRRIRQMEKVGEARFSVIDRHDQIEYHLKRAFYYHRLRWHKKSTNVHSMSEDMQAVYTASICQMANEGYTELFVLTVDELPYAYVIALKKDGFLYYLMPAHNVFSPYSPGTSLLYHILKHMKDSDYGELDFTIGEELYKSRFSNIVRQNRRVFFTFGSTPAFTTAMKLIDAVRSNTTLMGYVRTVRRKWGQTNYNVSDYSSRGLAKLRRLDYNSTKPHPRKKRAFPKGSCLIYKLNLANLGQDSGLQNHFRIQEISVIQAIKFIIEFHQCNSPTVWGSLFKREMEKAECFGTFLDNQLIHSSWVTDQKRVLITEIGELLKLEDGACCIFDCNTLEDFRGQGAYTQTLRHIAQAKQNSGYEWAYIYTLSSNPASIKGIERAGFELAEIRCRRAKSH